MKHPEVFSTVYALAPCCLAMEADLTEANPSWSKVVRLTSKEQLKPKPESLDDFYTIVFLALSAALSPNADRGPFFVDFPFKEREGGCVEAGPVSAASTKVPCLARNGTAYNNWVARLPLYMVEGKKENLLKLRGLFIDYGEKEEFPHIIKGGRLFSQALSDQNIPHVFEIYAGGTHGNKIRERVETRLLQFFSEKLDFSQN